mgnify:CR=1 FL=1
MHSISRPAIPEAQATHALHPHAECCNSSTEAGLPKTMFHTRPSHKAQKAAACVLTMIPSTQLFLAHMHMHAVCRHVCFFAFVGLVPVPQKCDAGAHGPLAPANRCDSCHTSRLSVKLLTLIHTTQYPYIMSSTDSVATCAGCGSQRTLAQLPGSQTATASKPHTTIPYGITTWCSKVARNQEG